MKEKSLLSICIPTYNRHEELTLTVDVILDVIAKSGCSGEVEIVICDNSDKDIAELNFSRFDEEPYVRYYKNRENIGFSKNVARVTGLAHGEFFWIVPDNDYFFIEAFVELLSFLALNRSCSDCIFVPFQYKELTGGEVVGSHYELCDKGIVGMLEKGHLPFILLSSAIIRNNLDETILNNILLNFSDNDFIQIPIILNNLNKKSKLLQFPSVVVDYQVEYDSRFSPAGCYKSISTVLEYIESTFSIDMKLRKDVEYISLWRSIMSGTTGIYNVWEESDARKYARKIFIKNISFKSLAFLITSFLPRSWQSSLYINYASLSKAKTIYTEQVTRLKVLSSKKIKAES